METLESKSFKTRHGTISVSLNKDNKGYFVVNKLVDNNGKITKVEKGRGWWRDHIYEIYGAMLRAAARIAAG